MRHHYWIATRDGKLLEFFRTDRYLLTELVKVGYTITGDVEK